MSVQAPAVLVVDDEPDTCRNLSDILQEFGYHVETACDGTTALALVRSRPFDVALLDFKMPDMDGVTLYREIKKLRPELVAILVSAYAGKDVHEAAESAGTWKVLSKPVDLNFLLPLVEQAAQQPLVLVVDDDHDLCANLWDLLRERGYRVGMAHSVPEARDRLAAERPYRLLLLDYRLQGGTGLDVLAAVRQLNADVRTVLISGHRQELEPLVREAVANGADAVYYKPLDPGQLLGTLQRLVNRGKLSG
jgi:two-component system, NtrC family, response regulator HydG